MRAIVLATVVAFGAVLLAGSAWTAEAQTADTAKVTLKVEGMTCAGCAVAVKMAAKKVDGVKATDVDVAKGTADVTYDPSKTSPAAIAKVITERSGFKTSVPKSSDAKTQG